MASQRDADRNEAGLTGMPDSYPRPARPLGLAALGRRTALGAARGLGVAGGLGAARGRGAARGGAAGGGSTVGGR
jgi:hypothetical protein